MIVNSRESGGGAATIAASLSSLIKGSKLLFDKSPPLIKFFNRLIEKGINTLNKKERGVIWSNNRFGNFSNIQELNQFDLVHLHWINDSFISIQDLGKITRPIVWTLHDLWPITGGCHIPHDCVQLQIGCGLCPKLKSTSKRDLSSKNLLLKKSHYLNKEINWVAPSQFVKAKVIENSSIESNKIHVIYNGIDLKPFQNLKRKRINKRPLLLFGALNWHVDLNKGAHFLEEVLFDLKVSGVEFDLQVFGAPIDAIFSSRLSYKNLGEVKKEDLPNIFCNSDLFLFPSFSETFGLMSVEAQASGTPVICLKGHGAEETVSHKKTGFHSQAVEVGSFVEAIKYSLENREELSKNCSKWIEEKFSSELMAKEYSSLYKSLTIN